MKNSLTALPVELLFQICEHLCDHCRGERNHPLEFQCDHGYEAYEDDVTGSKNAPRRGAQRIGLRNLGQTCRALREVAQPFLFHQVYYDNDSGLHRFARTLMERPDLRRHVFEIKVFVHPAATAAAAAVDQPHGRENQQVPNLTQLAKVGVERDDWWKGLASSRAWKHKNLINKRCAALVCLVLHLTPNLRWAHLCLPDSMWNEVGAEMAMWKTSRKLESLTQLSFDYMRDYKDSTTDSEPDLRMLHCHFDFDAVPIIRMAPNLTALRCCGSDGLYVRRDFAVELGRETPDGPAPLQHLTKLTFSDMGMDRQDLVYLLAAVGPGLSKVGFENCGGYRRNIPVPFILGNLFFAWKETITELAFLDHPSNRWRPLHRDLTRIQPFLVQFRQLKVLKLRTNSIQEISRFLSSMLSQVTSGNFPKLRRVEIDNNGGHYTATPPSPAFYHAPEIFYSQMLPSIAGLASKGVLVVFYYLKTWEIRGVPPLCLATLRSRYSVASYEGAMERSQASMRFVPRDKLGSGLMKRLVDQSETRGDLGSVCI
jgi:hypothetical protein